MSIYNTLLGQYKNYSDEPPVPPTPGPDYSEPFYVEDVSGLDNILSITQSGYEPLNITVEKSTDKINWTTMGTTSSTPITATIPANGKLYLRCDTNAWCYAMYAIAGDSYNIINCTGNYNVGGNTMSLLYGSSFTGNETSLKPLNYKLMSFAGLFKDSTTLISSNKLLLPAETLKDGCYCSMFQGCTSLTAVPELPATTLAAWCYSSMFNGCTGLTTAPELPATTLASDCYAGIFRNCTSLTTAPELPAKTMVAECYYSMFNGCTGLTTAPELPSTTLATACYSFMFQGCTSLTTAPELPATTLVKQCYQCMFKNCTSLKYMKVHFTTWPNLTTSSDSTWRGTTLWTQLTKNTTGRFVCPSTLPQYFNASGNNTTGTTVEGCCNAIPYGWAVETF